MRNIKRVGLLMLAGAAVGVLPHALFAASLEDRVRALEKKLDQESTQDQGVLGRVEAIEKEVKDSEKALADKLGFEIHGFVAANYNYNFNTPGDQTNHLHVFDQDANSIELDQANINIQRNKPEGLGFNVDVDFGKTAEVVGGSTRWSNNPNNTESNNSVELRQAYLKYTFPDSPFSIMAGKFVTFHGAEVIKAYNNMNYNISNSILFGFAIPFTHTGLIGTYNFPGDWGSVSAGVVNGWDNVVDNNDSKSIHSTVSLTPSSMVTFAVSTTYGAEQDNNGRSKRLMVTPLITVKPIDPLTFILDYNYGNESNVAFAPGVTSTTALARAQGNAMWQGAAGYVVYAATDALQLAFRAEVFDDPDGVRTLFQEPGFGPGATFWEFTPTVAYKITDGLTWRSEFRHDESDKRFFSKDDHFIRGQDLAETELIYAF
jgi:hypothetical protein